MAKKKQKKGDYGAGSIQVLKGLEAVRKRPGMYVGSTDTRGLHHLVWEVVDNSVDEAMAGHCSEIEVTIHEDNSISVSDDGRGIPVDVHPEEGRPGVELALTTLHAGGKFDKDSYQVSGGLHGVGVSCVNALSEWMKVDVDRDGERHHMELSRGGVTGALEVTGKAKATGTLIHFRPDPEIFEDVTFDRNRIARRLRQTAFLTPGLRLRIRDLRGEGDYSEEFYSDRGIAEMAETVSEGKGPLHPVIEFSGADQGVEVDVAFQYNDGYTEEFLSFVNNIRTPEGGTHETGFRAALTGSVTTYISENGNKKQKKTKVQGNDLKEGLVVVVSVRVPEPQFEGQTKGRLGNSEVRGIVQSLTNDALKEAFAENPKSAKKIMEKAISAARGRMAARKARDVARGQKSLLETGVLAGKLSDCSGNDASRNELFLVEGDSAGGTAKSGRDRNYQAILPLKGKILNTERARVDKILDNDEIKAIITALGAGFLHEFDLSKLRYNKIVILTDADVDGAHIRTLLLTLFFRHFRPLIENGHIYVAQPPLFRIRRGSKTRYAYSDKERDRIMAEEFPNGASLQRYKGLGEQNAEELWETTMDPANRTLLRVELDDAVEADRVFTTLMGSEVAPRREWIMDNAEFATVDL